MAYIENIVIGKPIATPQEMFSLDENDWNNIEKEKTFFTNERYLPRILVELKIYPSIGEIRRNRPDLMITFENKYDFIYKLKVAKKSFVWILVGKEE